MARPLFFLLCALFSSLLSFGQASRSDTTFIAQARGNSIARYATAIGGQSHLYNGSAYSEYISQEEEDPYFIDEWIDGSVRYDGELYTNVPILYDLTLDRVIIDNPFSIKKVMLVNEKVAEFTIQDHHFVHLIGTELDEAHYELAYDGNIKVYVRHKKALQSRVVDYSIFNQFEEKKQYYIYKDGKYISVRGKGSMLKVLGDKKKELKKFIRDNKLSFASQKIRDMARLAQYYDQLK